MTDRTSPDAGFLASGILMLAVAMGIGRFAYTPLLPLMERDAGLSVALAGGLASANLFGYLVGAICAMAPFAYRRRLAFARAGIAVVIVTTAAMALAEAAPLRLVLRCTTGIASAFVFIFTVTIVLERAAKEGKGAWPAILGSGVGIGVAFSGLAVPWFATLGGSRAAWLGLAAVSTIAIAATVRSLTDASPPAASHAAAADPVDGVAPNRHAFVWLLAIYCGEAFTYVIPATFLVAIVNGVPTLARYAAAAWVVVGIAGAIATGPWIYVGSRVGKARAMTIALAIQSLGIALLAFSKSPLAVVSAAIALGGTFIAITLFASGLARDLFPRRTSVALGRLTAVYGIGQVVGPIVATNLALRFGSYGPALLGAAGIGGLATIAALAAVRDPAHATP